MSAVFGFSLSISVPYRIAPPCPTTLPSNTHKSRTFPHPPILLAIFFFLTTFLFPYILLGTYSIQFCSIFYLYIRVTVILSLYIYVSSFFQALWSTEIRPHSISSNHTLHLDSHCGLSVSTCYSCLTYLIRSPRLAGTLSNIFIQILPWYYSNSSRTKQH